MVLESAQLFLQPLIALFSIFSAIYSFKVLRKLSASPDYGAGNDVRFVFQLLSFGFLLFAFAELSYSVLAYMGSGDEIFIPDLFWMFGYALLIAGYLYFSFFMYKQRGRLKEGIFLMSTIFLLSTGVIYYLLSKYVYGFQEGQSVFSIFLDYAYPIASTMTFVSAISIFLFFRTMSSLGIPFLVLALANGFDFIGNTLYAYYLWSGTYGIPGIISDVSFALFHFSAAAGLYILLKSRLDTNV